MDSKLIATIRTNYENKPTSELLSIWESNNQEEYSLEAFEAVKQILISRNQSLPPQKEFVEKEEEQFTQEQINQLIKKAMLTLLIWGAINIVYWYIGDAEGRRTILNRFTEIKPWLWIGLYGQLVIGILLLFLGFISLLLPGCPIALLWESKAKEPHLFPFRPTTGGKPLRADSAKGRTVGP